MENDLNPLLANCPQEFNIDLIKDLIQVLKKKTCFWCSAKGHWLNDCGNYRVLKRYSREDPLLQEAFQHLDKLVQAKVKLGEVFLEASSREGMEAYVGALFRGEQVIAPTPENVVSFVQEEMALFKEGMVKALKKAEVYEKEGEDDLNKIVDEMLVEIKQEREQKALERAAENE